jgi:hypothetical protein
MPKVSKETAPEQIAFEGLLAFVFGVKTGPQSRS